VAGSIIKSVQAFPLTSQSHVMPVATVSMLVSIKSINRHHRRRLIW